MIKIYCNNPEHDTYPLEIIRIRNGNEYFVECPECKTDRDKIDELQDEVNDLQGEIDNYHSEDTTEEMEENFETIKKKLISKLTEHIGKVPQIDDIINYIEDCDLY